MLPSLVLHKASKLSNAALLMVEASHIYRRSGITCCSGQLLLSPFNYHYNFTSTNYYSSRRKLRFEADLTKLNEYFKSGLQQTSLTAPVETIQGLVFPVIGRVGQKVSGHLQNFNRKHGLLKKLNLSGFDAWLKELEWSGGMKTDYGEHTTPGRARVRGLAVEFLKFLLKCVFFATIFNLFPMVLVIWLIAFIIAVGSV